VSQPVRAAGGIVLRGEEEDRSVALVHRPRYDDWSFPKGKLDDGEDDATAALREVEEETGLRCHLGPVVGTVTYRDRRGRPKVVRYFQMDADGGAFAPNPEVDELRWVPVEDAARLLSYEHDRRLLRRVLGGVPAYALYVVRHAKAGIRAAWTGPDQERPLTRRGRKQARRLVERFQGLEIERVVSSPFLRCVQTVEPLGEARGLPVEAAPELREGANVDELLRALESFSDRPTVVCGHGTEIESMIDRLERDGATIEGARGIAKGSVWVLDRDDGGRVVAAHYLPAPPG
jgi:8-oxo-dGTP diphosphatase